MLLAKTKIYWEHKQKKHGKIAVIGTGIGGVKDIGQIPDTKPINDLICNMNRGYIADSLSSSLKNNNDDSLCIIIPDEKDNRMLEKVEEIQEDALFFLVVDKDNTIKKGDKPDPTKCRMYTISDHSQTNDGVWIELREVIIESIFNELMSMIHDLEMSGQM